MKGIIIAGGLGTRLQPLTDRRPKHMLPLGNHPFLEYQVDLLRRHGITEVVFATGYMADQIERHFGDGSRFGISLRFAQEAEPLGTAGAIRNAAELFPGETCVVLNGDVLTDYDISRIVALHAERRALATIALRPVPRPHPFGSLELDDTGRVLDWSEPTDEEKRRAAAYTGPASSKVDFINAGIYVLDPSLIKSIPRGLLVSIERDIYPSFIASREPIYGVPLEGYWIDIGRPSQYLAASHAVLSGAVNTGVDARPVAAGTEIAEDAILDSLTSIGPECRIGSESEISGSIILAGCRIGARVRLHNVIVDDGAEIEEGCEVPSNTVVPAGARIRAGADATT